MRRYAVKKALKQKRGKVENGNPVTHLVMSFFLGGFFLLFMMCLIAVIFGLS